MNEPLGEREVLCVSQFTLYGDTRKGNRPAYVDAARPEVAEPLYERFCERLDAAARRVRRAHGRRAGQRRPGDRADRGPPARLPRMPICRFAAEPPQGGLPPEETLQAEFLAACLRVETEEDDPELGAAGEIHWFPDRTWSGRTYVPATARTDTGLELFGYVSFAPGDEPSELYAWADYTPDIAEDHPEWRMDISQEVVGGWRGERGEVAAMTLIWGVPFERRGRHRDRRARRRTRSTRPRSSATASRCSPPTPTTTSTSTSCCKDGAGNELVRESLYEDDDE